MASELDQLYDGYISAVYFTDTGDTDQPPATADLTPAFKAEAYIQCRNFYWALTEDLSLPEDAVDWKQTGVDLWFTRNNHGSGFWDKPEVYGTHMWALSAIATAMGAHEADFVTTVSA